MCCAVECPAHSVARFKPSATTDVTKFKDVSDSRSRKTRAWWLVFHRNSRPNTLSHAHCSAACRKVEDTGSGWHTHPNNRRSILTLALGRCRPLVRGKAVRIHDHLTKDAQGVSLHRRAGQACRQSGLVCCCCAGGLRETQRCGHGTSTWCTSRALCQLAAAVRAAALPGSAM